MEKRNSENLLKVIREPFEYRMDKVVQEPKSMEKEVKRRTGLIRNCILDSIETNSVNNPFSHLQQILRLGNCYWFKGMPFPIDLKTEEKEDWERILDFELKNLLE